jgi:hypothetical protein
MLPAGEGGDDSERAWSGRAGAGHMSQVLPQSRSCACMCGRACCGVRGGQPAGPMWQ